MSIILAAMIAVSAVALFPLSSGAATLKEPAESIDKNNDTLNNATTITVGDTITGDMYNDTDVDCYKFTVVEDGKVSINYDNLTENGYASGKWYIYLYGPNEETIAMVQCNLKDNTSIVLPFLGVKQGGTYYIMIYPGTIVPNGKYRIRTSFKKSKAYEQEGNNSEQKATKLILAKDRIGTIGGDWTNGDFDNCSDADYYAIKSPGDGTMSLSFNHNKKTPVSNAYSSWYVDFYNKVNGADRTVAAKQIFLSDSNVKLVKNLKLKKGESYWFRVRSAQDYELNNGGDFFNPSEIMGEAYTVASSFKLSAKPKLTAKSTKNSVTLTSKKIKNITGYQVQMKVGKKFKDINTCNKATLKYKKTGLKKNTRYTFRVRAYVKADGVKYYGDWATISAKTKKK